jgi:hypothetical protein
MTKWQSIDITWYTHFLDEAKRLLDPNDFITIKDKVCLFLFCKAWVTPNIHHGHLGELLL